jgi:hypothetical protein
MLAISYAELDGGDVGGDAPRLRKVNALQAKQLAAKEAKEDSEE